MTSETTPNMTMEQLFDAAKENGLEYVFTLVRVDGIQMGPDPLKELYSFLNSDDSQKIDSVSVVLNYKRLIADDAALVLLFNLLNCLKKERYNSHPFLNLRAGTFPNTVEATLDEKSAQVAQLANEMGQKEIADSLGKSFPAHLVDSDLDKLSSAGTELQEAYQSARNLLLSLLSTYFQTRMKFKDDQRLYKLPQFEVLELLVSNSDGLYGFQMHFSNGSSAKFARTDEGVNALNVMLGVPVNFMVGLLDDLRPEWRIGTKRLYEVGLPGRYNKPGEWKPIVYPGKPDQLQKDAMAISEFDEVRGTFFYMMCTGHRVIEFAVRSNIDLPENFYSIGTKMHLYKCPPLSEQDLSPHRHLRIYDGWVDLDSVEPDHVKAAIAAIAVGMGRLAFAFDGIVDWRIKYNMSAAMKSTAKPTKEDVSHLNNLLQKFPTTEDAVALDTSINWLNIGRSSRNVFMRYLGYYIAMESLAITITEGDATFGLDLAKKTKPEIKKEREDCIKAKYDLLFATDPERFVRESYFDCIVGLSKRMRFVAEAVFGKDHDYIKHLFNKDEDGYSLSDIRSEIAHGKLTHTDDEDEKLVKKRLPVLEMVSKRFVERLIFSLKPDDSLPTWSQKYTASMIGADPRSTMVASDENVFPTKDWRIRPEWLD